MSIHATGCRSNLTESVISPLPESAKSEILHHVGADSIRAFGNVSTLLRSSYAIHYNRRHDSLEDLDLPANLIKELKASGGIPEIQNRLGTLADDAVILNFQETTVSDAGFLLVVTFSDFSKLVDEIFPDCRLTQSEVRIILLLLCGYTIKEAAELDNVSHETKRSQLKSVSDKTGFSRQADLQVYVSNRLIIELRDGFYSRDRSLKHIFETHNRVMHPAVNLHVLVDPSGTTHRIMDMGPRSGKPVVVLHAVALPAFIDKDIEFLHDTGTRLLWPLRPGMLEPDEPTGNLHEFKQRYQRCLLQAIDLVADETSPIDLISVGSGCSHAIELCKAHPGRINSLSITSPCFRPKSEINSVNRVAQGLDKLAAFSPSTLSAVYTVMRSQLQKESVFARYMRGLGAGSNADSALVDYELAHPDRLRNMQTRILNSVSFFVLDHCTRAETDWHYIKESPVDVRFYHGAEDRFYPLPGIEKLASECRRTLFSAEGVGHFVYREHFTTLLAMILDNIDQS